MAKAVRPLVSKFFGVLAIFGAIWGFFRAIRRFFVRDGSGWHEDNVSDGGRARNHHHHHGGASKGGGDAEAMRARNQYLAAQRNAADAMINSNRRTPSAGLERTQEIRGPGGSR